MTSRLFKAGFLLLMMTALFFSCQQKGSVEVFKPSGDVDGFIALMEAHLDSVRNVSADVTEENFRGNRVRGDHKRAHVALNANYPIYYDWWLQDGDTVNWFLQDRSLAEQLALRMQKLDIQAEPGQGAEGLKTAFTAYFAACENRRAERLASFLESNPQVVFAKYEPFRPSFFAYTEAVSDSKGEFNYIPGTELALLTMDGIWGSEEVLIEDSLGVIRDPEVHFDGRHVLFSWKTSAREDDYHLYEMDLGNRKVKQITTGLGRADIEGIYLPDGNILFNSTRCGNSVDCANPDVSNMFLCDREGRYIRQVGFDQVHTVRPTLLDDGRIVYTRWDYNDRSQVWTQPLFQMNPDGTGQTEYYGVNSWFPTTATHVRQIPGTRKIMATMTGHHSPQHGKLGIIDPEAGRDENQGVMFVAPYHRPPADRVDSYGQFGDQFQYPFPLNEQEFLVSYSPLGYYVGAPFRFGIYWMNLDGERELLVSDPDNACNAPLLAAEREVPFARASTVDYTKDFGTYYVQNIYEGNSLKGIKPGEVKKLRIVELEFRVASVGAAFGFGDGGAGHANTPVGVGNTAWDVKRVLGTVDVYEDGSAFFDAPARTPLYFQALNEDGFVIQTMRSWSTLQPGEFQSCVGCHEHKNTVPVANHPVSIAMNAGSQQIVPHYEGGVEKGFSYIEEVQPIWDKHCISCHDGKKQSMSLLGDLKVVENQTRRKFSDSYLNLTHAYKMDRGNDSWQGDPNNKEVNWISALSEPTLLPPYKAGAATSNLIKRLENGHGGAKLTQAEIQTVGLWIDLLVPFVGKYQEAADWSSDEHKFYAYHEKKREELRAEERASVQAYIESLQKN